VQLGGESPGQYQAGGDFALSRTGLNATTPPYLDLWWHGGVGSGEKGKNSTREGFKCRALTPAFNPNYYQFSTALAAGVLGGGLGSARERRKSHCYSDRFGSRP